MQVLTRYSISLHCVYIGGVFLSSMLAEQPNASGALGVSTLEVFRCSRVCGQLDSLKRDDFISVRCI